jgi:hypothetical protein
MNCSGRRRNRRLTYSLESRAKAIDELLRELNSDFLLPFFVVRPMLLGLFLGIGIQSWRDSPSASTATPPPTAVQPAPVPSSDEHGKTAGNPRPRIGASTARQYRQIMSDKGVFYRSRILRIMSDRRSRYRS